MSELHKLIISSLSNPNISFIAQPACPVPSLPSRRHLKVLFRLCEPPNEVKDDSCPRFLENVQDLLTLSFPRLTFPANNIFFSISLYRPSSVIWLFPLIYDCAVTELPGSYICISHILLLFRPASNQMGILFPNGGSTKAVFTWLELYHIVIRLGPTSSHKRELITWD